MAWIAFIDESGDHGMRNIDPASPMFALTAAVYREQAYITDEIPSVAKSKFRFWNHEGAIFHAYGIKKKVGPFSICTDPAVQANLRQELCDLFRRSPTKIIAAVVDKQKHLAQYVTPENPYYLAVRFVLERIYMMTGKGTKIVFESRGKREDQIVADWCARICAGENYGNNVFAFEIAFAKKSWNVAGLQIADLACQPIIKRATDPTTQRPDWLAVRTCMRTGWTGKIVGFGLKIFP